MTDPNVPPVDPNEPVDPAPVDPDVDPENDDDLDPEVLSAPPANETPEQMQARINDLTDRNGKLWARLQRAKSKPASPAALTPPVTPTTPVADPAKPALSREEAVLIAKGYSLEEVEHANKVAEIEKKPLLEAVTLDLFTDWKSKRDKDAKDRAAQLGTSKGGRATVKKSFATPGLSDEEHREMFNNRNGR